MGLSRLSRPDFAQILGYIGSVNEFPAARKLGWDRLLTTYDCNAACDESDRNAKLGEKT